MAFLVADDQTVVREGLVMLLGCRRALRWWPRRATATKPPSSRNGLDPTWSVGLRRARTGARGNLTKDATAAEIQRAIRTVFAGEALLDASVLRAPA